MSSIGDWPTDLLPHTWEFYLQPNSRAFLSPATRTRQVLIGQGPRWVGTGSWRFRTRRQEQRFEALLDKLRGQANTLNVWDFAHKSGVPLGPNLDLSSLAVTYFTSPGSPGGITGFTSGSPAVITGFSGGASGVTIYGAGAVGQTSVLVRGFLGLTTQLYAGDMVGLGGFLYRLTEDAAAGVNGLAILYLNRPLVTALAHRAAVVRTRPSTPMQLLDDDQTRRAVTVGAVRNYTVSFVEAFF